MRIDNLSAVSGDVSLISSASYLAGGTQTYVLAFNTSSQSIPNNSSTTVTNWTNQQSQNASEWNPSTGIFTATKAGTYFVSAHLMYSSCTVPNANVEFSVSINKGSNLVSANGNFAIATGNIQRPTGFATAVINLVPTDTIKFTTYHNQGAAVVLSPPEIWRNLINITEIPGRITRA